MATMAVADHPVEESGGSGAVAPGYVLYGVNMLPPTFPRLDQYRCRMVQDMYRYPDLYPDDGDEWDQEEALLQLCAVLCCYSISSIHRYRCCRYSTHSVLRRYLVVLSSTKPSRPRSQH